MFKLYAEMTVGGSKVAHKEFDNENFSFYLEETKQLEELTKQMKENAIKGMKHFMNKCNK